MKFNILRALIIVEIFKNYHRSEYLIDMLSISDNIEDVVSLLINEFGERYYGIINDAKTEYFKTTGKLYTE